jgi:hypothetical protein
VAIVAAAGSRAKNVLGAVLVTIVVLLAMPILGIVESVGRWLPSHLVGALAELPGGAAVSDYLPATLVTVLMIGLALWLAVRGAEAREL